MIDTYITKPHYVDDMGMIPSIIVRDKPTESKEDEYLWHVNSMRRHDGLREYDSFKDIPTPWTYIQFELVGE